MLTKAEIILLLREFGLKARYSNICWFFNSRFEIVGGCLFMNNHSKVYFKVEDEVVSIVDGYDDVSYLIFGTKKGDQYGFQHLFDL